MLPHEVRALVRVLAAGTLLGLAPGAFSQTVPPATGRDLVRSCNALVAYATQGGEITIDATSCAAYLKGLRDAVNTAPVHASAERAFCAGGASLDAMARVVLKHIEGRSESAGAYAASEAMAALTRAYPCAKK